MKNTIIAAIVLILCSGCSHYAHRDKGGECVITGGNYCIGHNITIESDNANLAALTDQEIVNYGEYSLSFIELDDQGHQFSRERTIEVLDFVKKQGELKDAAGEDIGQDIILFIHGWHHNAGYYEIGDTDAKYVEDGNIISFRETLKNIAYFKKKAKSKRKTTGIYIGWRGESIDIPGVNVFTFYDRKNGSINVGNGDVPMVLDEIEQIRNDQNNSRLISIGHSFGGSVLFTAIQQKLKRAASKKTIGNKESTVKFGDLAILANPAIENTQYASLHYSIEERARNHPEYYNKPQRPNVMVLMSEADMATKVAFKIGRSLGLIFEQYKDVARIDRNGNEIIYNQTEMAMSALGHYEPFVTHTLSKEGRADNSCSPMYGHSRELAWDQTYPESNVTIEHQNRSPRFGPIWIVSVDEELIGGHNEIFGTQVHCFVKELILDVATK